MAYQYRRTAFLFLTILITVLVSSQRNVVTTSVHADSGGVINFDATLRGDLLSGEKDTWTFRGMAGQRVSIVAQHAPQSLLDPQLELRDPSNEIFVTDDDGGIGVDAALTGILIPENGLYAIVVLATDGTEGDYTLTLVENEWPADCMDVAGTMTTEDIFSEASGEQLRYSIYMPPCAEATERQYPYILLMHGSVTTNTHWDDLGMDEAIRVGYALNQLPPVALVLPYGGEIANLNYFGGTYSFENVLLNEIIPRVEARFCLQTEGSGRAIGGISRGGFWAWSIGLLYPERFTAVGGHSPVFDWAHAQTHNPLYLIANADLDDEFPRLYVDRGAFDWWADNIDLMAPQLERYTVPATVVVHETGTHDDDYWRSHLQDYLDFYTQDWTADWTTFPTC